MGNLSIQQSVIIREGQVLVDGQLFFESDDTTFGPFAKELYKQLECKYSKFYKMDGLSKLGFLGAEILMGCQVNDLCDDETALVFCNRSSSLNTDVKYQATIKEIPSPAVFVYTLPNIVIGEICIRHGIKGEAAFFVKETEDPTFIVDYVKLLFATTNTKQCLTGWVEIDAAGQYEARLYIVSDQVSERPFSVDNIRQKYN